MWYTVFTYSVLYTLTDTVNWQHLSSALLFSSHALAKFFKVGLTSDMVVHYILIGWFAIIEKSITTALFLANNVWIVQVPASVANANVIDPHFTSTILWKGDAGLI